jgi:hypothetical protein
MTYKIVDNWYENPDEIRNLALSNFKAEEYPGLSDKNGDFPGFYPGFRCRTTIENSVYNLKKFQSIFNNRIKESEWIHTCSVECDDPSLWEFDFLTSKPKLKEHNLQVNLHAPFSSNGCFQYIPKDSKTWIHSDQGNKWAAVIYLHPDPPKETGTGFYKRKKTEQIFHGLYEEDVSAKESLDENNWELHDYVENVYNRCIIYEGKHYHTASKFFGESVENSRLTQVFFFDVIKDNVLFEYKMS